MGVGQVLQDILPGDDGKHCECQVTPGTPFYQGHLQNSANPIRTVKASAVFGLGKAGGTSFHEIQCQLAPGCQD